MRKKYVMEVVFYLHEAKTAFTLRATGLGWVERSAQGEKLG